MNEVYKQLAEVNCSELLLSIAARRISKDKQETPQSLISQFHCIYDFGAERDGIKIDKYSSRENRWTEIETICLNIKRFALIHHDDRLIMIGGVDAHEQATSTVERNSLFETNEFSKCHLSSFQFQVKSFHLKTRNIVDLPPMISERISPSADVMSDSIFVFGGFHSNGAVVHSVERWEQQAPPNKLLFDIIIILNDSFT